MKISIALAAAAASLTLAAPAAAARPADPPAPGVLEHRVFEVYDAARQGATQRQRGEHFVAANRDRAVITDSTGRITSESVKNGTSLRHFDAQTNTLEVTRHGIEGYNFVPSRAGEGRGVDHLIGLGSVKVTGETTWNGRAALTATMTSPYDAPGLSHTVILDARTRQYLESVSRDASGTVVFHRTLLVDEDLPLAGNESKLEMSDHAGARVVAKGAKAKGRKKARR